MLRRSPHHDFPRRQLIQIFYNGLSILNQTIDVVCGGMIRRNPQIKLEGAPYHFLRRPTYRSTSKCLQTSSHATSELRTETIGKEAKPIGHDN
ncbi:hypothetical protein CR513_57021, partial [Mucuna pruriens]